MNGCYPGSSNPVPVASSAFPSLGSSTRAQQSFLNTPGQTDDGFSAYGSNHLVYPASYGDRQMTTGAYRNSDAYLWSADASGHRSQAIPDNLRRTSYATPRYFPLASSSALTSTNPSAFPSMGDFRTTLPVPHVQSSRSRYSVGSNVQMRSNGMDMATNSIELGQLQSGSNSRGPSTSIPWLDSDSFLPASQTLSTSLSASNAASYAPLSISLTPDALLPHRSSYDFSSQSYSRNPSLTQGVDAAESLPSLGQYSITRNAPQPARSPSDQSSDDSTSFVNNGSRNYTFIPNIQGSAATQPPISSMSAPFVVQEPVATSLPPRTLSSCSTSDTQTAGSQNFTGSHELSRRASTRQLVGETNRQSLSGSSTDGSGK